MHRYLALAIVLAASTWASASVDFEDAFVGELTARALLPNDDTVAALRRRAPCRPGQYFTSRCRSCTSGSYCPDGQVRVLAMIRLWYPNLFSPPPLLQNRFDCGAGAYSGPGASRCTLCPYGTFSSSAFLLLFVPCTGPSRHTDGDTEPKTKYVTGCETVAPGHRANAPIGATGQLTCGKGTYSSGATDTCTMCPAGSKCTSRVTEEPTQCAPGTYSNAGNSADCTECPRGTFNNVHSIPSIPILSPDRFVLDLRRKRLLLVLLGLLRWRSRCYFVFLLPIRSRLSSWLDQSGSMQCEEHQWRIVLQPVQRRSLPCVTPSFTISVTDVTS